MPGRIKEKKARLFIGLPVPDHAKKEIAGAMGYYSKFIEKKVPKTNWHLTLLFLGEVKYYHRYLKRLTEDMSISFVPTVSITHVGRGYNRSQLWAYAQQTKLITGLRAMVRTRLVKLRVPVSQTIKKKDVNFTPHINLAKLYAVSLGIGMADKQAATVFAARQIYIYKSEPGMNGTKYTVAGKINLMP